jgi:hypothetical protein
MLLTSETKPLKSNPFITYRDPMTGKWVVVNQNLPIAASNSNTVAA